MTMTKDDLVDVAILAMLNRKGVDPRSPGATWARVQMVRVVPALLEAVMEELGHTNLCSMQLQSPKYRQCTCWQAEVRGLLEETGES